MDKTGVGRNQDSHVRVKKGWRGYNFSRPIDGNMIPQRVQNLVIRTYCQNEKLDYLLSATEYSMDSSYMILYTIYQELDAIEGIVFYSIHMLPSDSKVRKAFFDEVLRRGGGVRFALEELAVLKPADLGLIEEIMICKELKAPLVSESWFKL